MKKSLQAVVLLIMVIAVGIGGYRFNYPYLEDPYRRQVYALNNVKTALQQMEEDRMIFSAQLVSWLLTLTGMDTRLHKGVYEVDNRMGTYRILQKWLTGEQKTVVVTVKEGNDLFDIGTTLQSAGIVIDQGEWLDLIQSPRILESARKILGFSPATELHTLEGFLFPDTYYLFAGNSPEEFIDLALKRFLEKTQPLLASSLSDEHKLTLFKMASLVEKETSVPEEKPLVASVIYNRLKIKMKLRFDPTVIYALKTTGKYYDNFKDGFINIKREHYYLASPHNTYYIKGLPLTPISSFGIDSLQAVLDPAETDYLFFVAKRKGSPQEGHYFTTNYEDHLKYLNRMLGRN